MKLLLAARLSRLGTKGQDGLGIETQDKRSREWAIREGHEVIDIAADHKSGTVAPWDRPHLKPWVTDPAKMAMYDGVLAYKNDRLSRGAWDDETRIRQWAQEHGKRLVIADGPQWPPRDDGDFWSWTAQAKLARQEWEAIRERSMRAQKELLERGKLVGRPPFGYVSVGVKYDHTMVPTDEGRRVIPVVFAMCIAGDSQETIAKWLKQETGRDWWSKSVGGIIRNHTYAGHRQDAQGRTILHVEALVDAVTFRRANKALTTRLKRGPANNANKALLTTALFCGKCDNSPMYRINSGVGQSGYLAYRCTGRGAHRKGCGTMVKLDLVDSIVDEAMTADDRPIMERRVIPGTNSEAELEDLKLQIRDLAARIDDMDDDAYDAEFTRLRGLRDALRALPATPDTVVEAETGETYAGKWTAADREGRRAMLKSLRVDFEWSEDREPVVTIGPRL